MKCKRPSVGGTEGRLWPIAGQEVLQPVSAALRRSDVDGFRAYYLVAEIRGAAVLVDG